MYMLMLFESRRCSERLPAFWTWMRSCAHVLLADMALKVARVGKTTVAVFAKISKEKLCKFTA
uniref:Uncharacterized protein n=1 Tax=Ciona intestinalis TaxID=7719 RepID=H2XM62_CIOIN